MHFTILFLAALLALSGCSPSLLTGDKKSDFKDSGRYNKECFGLNLSAQTFDVPTARSLVGCLNSNQSMQSLQAITDSLNDEELSLVVDFIANEFIANRTNAREVEITLEHLENAGVSENIFKRYKKLVSNEKLLNGVAGVLATFDADSFKALHLLVDEMSENGRFKKNTVTLFEFIEKFSNTKAATGIGNALAKGLLVDRLAGKGPEKKDFASLAGNVHDFILHKTADDHATGKLLLWGLADESLFSVVKNYLGSSADQVHRRVFAFDQIVRLLTLENVNGANEKMTRIFSILDGPLACFEGTKEIPNGSVYVMNRFASWNALDVPDVEIPAELFKLKVASSFCGLPKGFNDLLSLVKTMVEYSDATPDGTRVEKLPLMTSTDIVKAILAADTTVVHAKRSEEARKDLSVFFVSPPKYPFNERYRRLLVQLLGDRSPDGAYEKLSASVAEFAHPEKKIVKNLLYLIHALAQDDTLFLNEGRRPGKILSDAAYVLVRPRPELQGRSIYDALISKLGKVSRTVFVDLMEGFADAYKLHDDTPSFSKTLLHVSLSNNSDVFSRIFTDLVEELFRDKKKSDLMVRILQKPEFKQNLVLLKNLSEESGFKDFVRGMLAFLVGKKFKHSAGISKTEVPLPGRVNAGVDLSADDKWSGTGTTFSASGAVKDNPKAACYLLDYDSSLFDPGLGHWSTQMKAAASCMNVSKDFSDFEVFMNYGSSPDAPQVNGKINGKEPLLSFMMNYFKGFMPFKSSQDRKKAFDELSDYFFSNQAESDIRVFGNVLGTFYGNNGTSPARVFYRLLGGMNMNQADALGELSRFTGKFMLDDSQESDRDIKRALTVFYNDMKTIGRDDTFKKRAHSIPWIDNRNYPADLVHDYLYSSTPNRTVYQYKTKSEVLKKFEPIRKRLQDRPHELKALISFFGKLDESERGWFDGWIKRMTSNQRVIDYYPPGLVPGKDKPVQMLANDFDLLELVATDAGFTLNEMDQSLGWLFQPMNADFAVKYFTQLALTDENTGKNLNAYIRHAFKDIRKYLKIIKGARGTGIVQEDLLRRLTNLEVTLQVLVSMFERKTGTRTDLDVLRDLFFAVLQATPPDKWRNYERQNNSLAAVVEIAKLGLLRNMAPKLQVMTKAGPQQAPSLSRWLGESASPQWLGESASPQWLGESASPQWLDLGGFLALFESLAKNSDLSTSLLHKMISSSKLTEALIGSVFELSLNDREKFKNVSSNSFDLVTQLHRLTPAYRALLKILDVYLKDAATIDLIATTVESALNFLAKETLTKPLLALQSDRVEYSELPGALNIILNKSVALASDQNGKTADAARLFSIYLIEDRQGFLKELLRFEWEFDAALGMMNDRFVRWVLNPGEKSQLSSRVWNFAGLGFLDGTVPSLINFVSSESRGYSDSFYINTVFLSDPKHMEALINFMKVVRLGVQDMVEFKHVN